MHTADAREQMIEQQVRAWDVLDARVLEVMRRVPRELFVPSAQRYRAYADVEVPLARGQHMLRSEEHTSELQSPCNLVCRLLLEKKKTKQPWCASHSTQTNRTREVASCHLDGTRSV